MNPVQLWMTAAGFIGLILAWSFSIKRNRRYSTILLLIILICGFQITTPQKALQGAPFHRYSDSQIAMYACSLIARKMQVCSEMASVQNKLDSLTECLCKNKIAFATTAHCFDVGYPDQVDAFLDLCNERTNAGVSRKDYSDALDFYRKEAAQTVSTEPLHPPQVPSQVIYTYRDAYDQFLGNYTRSVEYGIPIIAFWAIVFIVAAIDYRIKLWAPKITNRFTDPVSNTIRKSFTLPALLGRQRTQEKTSLKIFDYLQPSRMESMILIGFCGLTTYLSVCKIHPVENDPIFPSSTMALLRYYSVRSGIIATYILPLSFLFAGRNNILQGFTGWTYSTFITFHRWTSRIMVLLILVHSVGYGALLHKHTAAPKAYIYYGFAGTVAGIALLGQALLVLRRKFYEMFLAIHIILAAVFLAGAWMHVKNLNFLWYYHFSLWVWLADRAYRIQRLLQFGFPNAEVELFADSTLRVKVRRPPSFLAEGGGHCFVHFLLPLTFWQSHPFTYTVMGDFIVFYIKVKEGVTRDLQRQIERSKSKSVFVRVAVEGSYGECTPARNYDSKIFVAGGNGIPGIFAEAYEAVSSASSHGLTHLIWVVRDIEAVRWFQEELNLLRDYSIAVTIYVTRLCERAPLLGDSDKSNVELEHSLPHVVFKQERPNIAKIVSFEVFKSNGSVCFVTCGHPAMVDDLRYEVTKAIGSERKRIDFFEQLQVWA